MQSRHSRKKDSGESNEGAGGGAFSTNSIQVVSLSDLFTCTQHWGIYVPV